VKALPEDRHCAGCLNFHTRWKGKDANYCENWHTEVPEEAQAAGCDDWLEEIPF